MKMEDKKTDLKIFFKDIVFGEIKELKKDLKKPATYSNTIFFLVTIYFLVKLLIPVFKGTKPLNLTESTIISILILLAVVLYFISRYKSGVHRHRAKMEKLAKERLDIVKEKIEKPKQEIEIENVEGDVKAENLNIEFMEEKDE